MPLHLDLHRRVVDLEMVGQFIHDVSQDLLPFADGLLGDDNVDVARDRTGADRPDMQVAGPPSYPQISQIAQIQRIAAFNL